MRGPRGFVGRLRKAAHQLPEGLLTFVSQAAAGGIGAGRIDRTAAFFDVGDLAVLVDHEGGAAGNAQLGNQDAILLGDLTHVVAEKGVVGVELFFPMSQGRREIGTDREDLSIILIKISDTRLVRGEFLRSTTGEGGHEECQDDNLFAAEIRELHGLVVGVGQSEVGGFVTDFEIGFRRCDLLRRERGREYRACQECTDSSHDSSLKGSNYFQTG